MEARSAAGDSPSGAPVAPPRQRWRLILARSADAPRLAGRELTDAWEAAIEATGLPLHRPAGKARGRVAFAAPLQLGIEARRELADIFLADRVPIWAVRAALSGRLPAGWRLIDLSDVWVGAPALAGRVVAADYLIELATAANGDDLESVARSLLEARDLPRVRQKGEGTVAYDLRSLLADVSVDAAAGTMPRIRVRTRIHPELGTGRPEEVIAALGDRLGCPLEIGAIVRERLILADDRG